ncbi:Beta-lactamase class C and other penicillin binding protein [Labilithrix luteola]|uniref:Beta-lactamase class C and other penicillin binding protein n=2 Tax=Labilithrix luteola TaxID=1391654 RepID=A0A0K1PM09_9BACT|nr:Beta-lactamase class C and other penicillin binding protein [Labilithrix luteola]
MPSLSAPSYFESREVPASPAPEPLKNADSEFTFALERAELEKYANLEDLLAKNETRAFLVLKNDRVVYERYFGDVNANTELPSFSMSKTVAALLVGCAIQDGIIASVDDPLVAYAPETRQKKGYDRIKIEHLLRMTSGLDFGEESAAAAYLYYSHDLPSRTYDYDVKWEPGSHYLYGSISTQILWDVIHRQLRGATVSHYFQRRVWGPLGAQHAASWSLDSPSSGVEKFFGGFNATLRDHARFGLLFLHGGTFQGRSVLPEAWVREAVSPDPIAGTVHTTDGWVRRAKYQWFLTLDGRAYFAKGFRGQYIFVIPSKDMVIVRFGEGYGTIDWTSLFLRMSEET